VIAWLAGATVAVGGVATGINAIVDSAKTAGGALATPGPAEKFARELTNVCLPAAARISGIDHQFDPSLPKIARRRVDLQVELIERVSRMKPPDSTTRAYVQLYVAPTRALTEFGYNRAEEIPTTLGFAQVNLNKWFKPSPEAEDLMGRAKDAARKLRAPACGDDVLLWAV